VEGGEHLGVADEGGDDEEEGGGEKEAAGEADRLAGRSTAAAQEPTVEGYVLSGCSCDKEGGDKRQRRDVSAG
jgi:hypothetical protein